MKKLKVIPKKIKSFISIIIFTMIMCLVIACAPATKKVWTKPSFTQQEWATDNYACMQQAQQSHTYYVGRAGYLPPKAESRVITNWDLFNACMESRGWRLVEER